MTPTGLFVAVAIAALLAGAVILSVRHWSKIERARPRWGGLLDAVLSVLGGVNAVAAFQRGAYWIAAFLGVVVIVFAWSAITGFRRRPR